MRPKKIHIDKAIKNGSLERINKLIAGSHMLMMTANNYIEEATDLMLKCRIFRGELKMKHTNFVKSADEYLEEYATMVHPNHKMDMFKDIDSFDIVFRAWSKIEKNFTPKED